MENIKKYTGTVSVDGDLTPITRKPIDVINADLWPEMTIEQLYDQRIMLNNRIHCAVEAGMYDMVQQLQHGMVTINGILSSKELPPVGY